ncbi:MAG: hypothetical protein B7Y02_13970 [Rhodobacterales bacterium 17-64-5]|nr:MAG: hypothetical protein B7Y02_13970 [Rhodobacterales bacterium 17-64-5]
MRNLVFAALTLAALPAGAETPLSAAAFEAQVTGKTITYEQYGSIFGIEEYLPGRQVRWSVAENLCQYGVWFQKDDRICFVYEDDPTSHCFTFRLEGGALVALSDFAQPGAELREVDRSTKPLSCPGPDVGV